MRVVPRRNDDVNETRIADRDRFAYEGLYSEDRLGQPKLRGSDGAWVMRIGKMLSRPRPTSSKVRSISLARTR